MSITWNTGAAAERFRHNLKLKNKKAAGRKRQATSFKRLKKNTIKKYNEIRKQESMKISEVKKIVNWMYSKDNPNHKYNKKNNSSKKETLKSFLKQNNENK